MLQLFGVYSIVVPLIQASDNASKAGDHVDVQGSTIPRAMSKAWGDGAAGSRRSLSTSQLSETLVAFWTLAAERAA
jgi:hypothetical protein